LGLGGLDFFLVFLDFLDGSFGGDTGLFVISGSHGVFDQSAAFGGFGGDAFESQGLVEGLRG